MRPKLFLTVVALSIVHGSRAPGPLLAQQATSPSDALATAPDLAALQERIQSVVKAALPSMVSISTDSGAGTGVIISPEGLILTQGHVLGLEPRSPVNSIAGLKFRFGLHDFTHAEAEVVGADTLFDLVLLRAVKHGTYPFTPLAEYDPTPGMGVLRFGRPLEVQGYPAASVRFGTVLATKLHRFVTDCAGNGGDSGGAFVDLDGRVVGMNSSWMTIVEVPGEMQNRHYWNTRGRRWTHGTTSTVFRKRLARMAKGEFITPTEADVAQYDMVFDASDWRSKNQFLYRDCVAEERRTQGKEVLGRFRSAVAEARKSVVEILDGDETTALGTVVDAAGLILTKASEVPEEVRCRLPGGQVTPAVVVGVDPTYDLALLRIPAAGLVPVTWAKKAEPPAGTLVAAVGTGELPATVGIVSVARRDTPGPHPSAPCRYQRPVLPASPPEINGSSAADGRFVVETSEGSAAAAGIRPGDVILAMAGEPVPDNNWIKEFQGMNPYDRAWATFQKLPLAGHGYDEKGRRARERVPVRLLRGDKQIELNLTLPAPKETEIGFGELWVPSKHDAAPPTMITSDIPVYHTECGAPAVDLDGTPIGLVISRFIGETASFIIPGDRVAARLADLRLRKPLSALPGP